MRGAVIIYTLSIDKGIDSFSILGVIFTYYLICSTAIHRHLIVIEAIEIVCRLVLVIHIAYAIVGQVRYNHAYIGLYNLKIVAMATEVCAVVVVIKLIVVHDCFTTVGQYIDIQPIGRSNHLIYTIDKHVEATVIEVV